MILRKRHSKLRSGKPNLHLSEEEKLALATASQEVIDLIHKKQSVVVLCDDSIEIELMKMIMRKISAS